MQIGSQLGAGGKTFEATKAHVLADLADQTLAHVFQGRAEAVLAISQSTQRSDIGRIALGDQLGRGLGQREEAVALGDEVGFAVDFDHGADVTVDTAGHDPFGRDAGGRLARLVAELDAQQFLGFFHVAVGLGQGPFALHHRCVGFAAQFGNHACGNCSHRHILR